ncbi:hypothetical protein L7F22_057376 [Adiantum nelumboides]|nr:hypothetical protein [Adiantum nelumboides]
MDLKGVDIHDFLSCLGRHAITNATFGFGDARPVELKSHNIVFVEDTDELAQAEKGGFDFTQKKKSEASPTGWGAEEDAQKEDSARWGPDPNSQGSGEPTNSGWGLEMENEVKEEPMPSSPARGTKTSTEERKEARVSSVGWASSDGSFLDHDGWAGEQTARDDASGGHSLGKTDDNTVPASDDGAGWGSEQVTSGGNDWNMTEKTVAKTGNDSTNRVSKLGLMHPSRKNIDGATDNVADKRRTGKFGPSGSNMVPLGKRRFGTKPDLSHNVQEGTMLKDMQDSQDKEEQIEWGMPATEAKAYGSNTLLQEKRGAHREVQGQEEGSDEWASKTDWGNAPTGQADPKLAMDVDEKSNRSPRAGDASAGWGSDSKEHEGEWGQMPPVQGKKETNMDSCNNVNWSAQSNTEVRPLSPNGWGPAVPPFQAQQETNNDNVRSGNWSSQPDSKIRTSNFHGWGSEKLANAAGRDDGWNDMQPDDRGVPEVRKYSWGLESREPMRRDLTPRKTSIRYSTGSSRVGFGPNSPQSQSRRPRIRALLNLPEYSELNELYKASNRILHHSEYQPGDKLKPEDEKFILEQILVHHPDKEAKLGCGVDHVMIDFHVEHQVSCFWVAHKDGSRTDFSYWKCLEGLLETKYPAGMTNDLEKGEGEDSWRSGVSSLSIAKKLSNQDKAHQDYSTVLPSCISHSCDQEETKDCWNTETAKTAPKSTISDPGSWGMGAESLAPAKTTSYQQWMDVNTPNEMLEDVGGAWEVRATSIGIATNICDQIEVKSSGWEM